MKMIFRRKIDKFNINIFLCGGKDIGERTIFGCFDILLFFFLLFRNYISLYENYTYI